MNRWTDDIREDIWSVVFSPEVGSDRLLRRGRNSKVADTVQRDRIDAKK